MSQVFAAAGFQRAAAAIVGHRGGRGPAWPAENTVAAFARAHAEGAAAVELDVRTCIGGHVVVMHDRDLARMTGGCDRRAVARITRGELARIGLGGHGESGTLAGRDHAPMLDDVLDWARGRVALNVEAKHDVPDCLVLARGIAKALAQHPDVEVLLSSFDPPLLAMLRALAPRVPRAWLVHEGQRRWEPLWSRLAMRAPLFAVHLERTLADPATVEALHDAGKRVGVWTVNDPGEAQDLAAIGVDWLVTDAPGALRQSQVTGTVGIAGGGG